MSKKFEFKIISCEDLDLIKPLWKNLKDHHTNISPHFQEKYQTINFEDRKEELLKKSSRCNMRVEVVSDCDKDCFVGYCISSISDEGKGEIDSIYLEKKYRKLGLGKEMVKRAIAWMESQDTDELKIVVAVGNEDLLPFYSSFNFFPDILSWKRRKRNRLGKEACGSTNYNSIP